MVEVLHRSTYACHVCIFKLVAYHGLGEDWPRVNVYITRSQSATESDGSTGFSWSPICTVVTMAAKQDTW